MPRTPRRKSTTRSRQSLPGANQAGPLQRVTPDEVVLTSRKGSPGRGGGRGGEAWRVDVAGRRAGVAFINLIDEPPLGLHASVQVHLNLAHQGRGIGRIVFAKAFDSSRYDTVYAHVRKSNVASRRALEYAGFVDATPDSHQQIILRRSRRSA